MRGAITLGTTLRNKFTSLKNQIHDIKVEYESRKPKVLYAFSDKLLTAIEDGDMARFRKNMPHYKYLKPQDTESLIKFAQSVLEIRKLRIENGCIFVEKYHGRWIVTDAISGMLAAVALSGLFQSTVPFMLVSSWNVIWMGMLLYFGSSKLNGAHVLEIQ
jgi:hypothetical protein